jgi:hypothetical protein
VFAFAEDPVHPILWNATVPTQNNLLALADSVAFMPWKGWSMDVSHKLIRGQRFYTYSDAGTSTVTLQTERFADFGVISCITSSVSQGSSAICGVLYMETVIELEEFCPIVTTAPVSASPFMKHKAPVKEKSVNSDEDKKIDEEIQRLLSQKKQNATQQKNL